jgi:hypothetical protein
MWTFRDSICTIITGQLLYEMDDPWSWWRQCSWLAWDMCGDSYRDLDHDFWDKEFGQSEDTPHVIY